MKNAKRLWLAAVAMCLVVCMLLSGCGKKEETEDTDTADETSAAADTNEGITPVEPEVTEPEVKVETKLVGTVVNVSGGVNVRSGPSTESDILTTAELGTQFTVLKEFYTSDWHKVEYKDGVAYINADYLEVVEVEVAPSEQTPDESTDPDAAPTDGVEEPAAEDGAAQ